jgi:hypothetical protein
MVAKPPAIPLSGVILRFPETAPGRGMINRLIGSAQRATLFENVYLKESIPLYTIFDLIKNPADSQVFHRYGFLTNPAPIVVLSGGYSEIEVSE